MEVFHYSKMEFLPKEPSIPVLIRSFTVEDIEEVLSLLSKNMTQRQCFWVGMNFNSDLVCDFYKESIDLYLSEGFSLVAVINQKIIGFISAFDYNNSQFSEPYKKTYKNATPNQLKKAEAHSRVYEGLTDFKVPDERGVAITVRNLVVESQFEGKGLGSLLLNFVNYHPKCLQYSKVLIECVSKSTEIIGVRLGFQILKSIKWVEMTTKDGEPAWKDLPENLEKKAGKEVSLFNDTFSLGVLKR